MVARYLLSKYFIYKESLLYEERFCLCEVILALLDVKDPLFKFKYGNEVRYASLLLAIFNEKGNRTEKVIKISQSSINLHRVWLNERKYHSAKITYSSTINSFVQRTKFYKRKKLPPKRYIGVGYRDKGSKRNTAYDGSPAWQEVATADILKEKSFENKSREYLTFFGESKGTIYNESNRWIRKMREMLYNLYPTESS